ncbi:MAG: biopolymer transporter ExbD [Polyangiaceae bacterium]|nr:biopolymer transporter ExbD [Polyangiaceae bacterium]
MRCFVSVLLLALATASCGDPKASGSGSGASTGAPSQTAAATSQAPKPKSMPNLLVDAEGPYLGMERVRMQDPNAADKLTKLVKDLPIEGKPVTLLVEKKAKVAHVAAVVTELGKAGAPKVIIKTDGRNDVPKELNVVPEPRVSSPPPCSIATMVLKDFSTAIWPIRGGTARKHSKGMAGPDLSNTGQQVKKDIEACESSVAFFSSDESIDWELAFNLAGTVVVNDDKKKIDTLVLLSQIPVAGRPVTLGK